MKEKTFAEKYYAAERLTEFFNLSTHLDTDHIYDNEQVCYGKLDPINVDEVPEIITNVGTTLSLPARKHHAVAMKVMENTDVEILIALLKSVSHRAKAGILNYRIFSYLINAKLSELGVAPRWREIEKPSKAEESEWSREQRRYLCDLQVFDLQWIHASHPGHRVMNIFSDVMVNIFNGESFDYSLAQVIATADIKIHNKIRYLKLNEDIQSELVMLRSRSIDADMRKLERNAEQVEMDLQHAANRNRNRGEKLRKVIPDWVMLWKSTRVVESSSISLMHENYQKLSGKKISRRTYTDKLKRLDRALREVDSYYTLDFLENRKSR